jgi:cytosine permease
MGWSSGSRSRLPRTDNHDRGVSKYTARSRRFSQNSVVNWVPLVMIIVVIPTIGGLSNFNPSENHPGRGFAAVLEIVIGFFN